MARRKAKQKPPKKELVPDAGAAFRERLTKFYTRYNPDPKKLAQIDDVLVKYKGKEEKLFTALRKKYPASANDVEIFPQSASSRNTPQEAERQPQQEASTRAAKKKRSQRTGKTGRGSRSVSPASVDTESQPSGSETPGAIKGAVGLKAEESLSGRRHRSTKVRSTAGNLGSLQLENEEATKEGGALKGHAGLLYDTGEGAPTGFVILGKEDMAIAKQKRKTAFKENRAAVKIQSVLRAKSAKANSNRRRSEGRAEDEKVNARKIQSVYRGRRARSDLAQKHAAASKVQAAHRGRHTRRSLSSESQAAGSERLESASSTISGDQAAARIQAHVRGRAARKSVVIQGNGGDGASTPHPLPHRQKKLEKALQAELSMVHRELELARLELGRERERRIAAQRRADERVDEIKRRKRRNAESGDGEKDGSDSVGNVQARLRESEAELRKQRSENALLKERVDALEKKLREGEVAARRAERMVVEAEEVLTMKESEVYDLRNAIKAAERQVQYAREQERSRVRIEMEHLRAEVEWRARYANNRQALERGIARAFSGSELMAAVGVPDPVSASDKTVHVDPSYAVPPIFRDPGLGVGAPDLPRLNPPQRQSESPMNSSLESRMKRLDRVLANAGIGVAEASARHGHVSTGVKSQGRHPNQEDRPEQDFEWHQQIARDVHNLQVLLRSKASDAYGGGVLGLSAQNEKHGIYVPAVERSAFKSRPVNGISAEQGQLDREAIVHLKRKAHTRPHDRPKHSDTSTDGDGNLSLFPAIL